MKQRIKKLEKKEVLNREQCKYIWKDNFYQDWHNKYIFVRIPRFRLNRMIFLCCLNTRQHIKSTIKKYLKATTNCSAKPAQSKLQSQKGSSTSSGLVLRNNIAASLVWKYKEKTIYFRRVEVKMGQELFHKESVKPNANRVGSVEFSAPQEIQNW